MTPEAQRIAIAEACGWRPKQIDVWDGEDKITSITDGRMPNYLKDLNAMHEAAMSQTAEFRMKMNNILIEMMPVTEPYQLDRTINATASQRAEAFLRTLNLWKD